MDTRVVTGELQYLDQGFTIMELGIWGGGTEGGGHLGLIWKIKATRQDIVSRKIVER